MRARTFQCGDLITTFGVAGDWRTWEVVGDYVGGIGQENVVGLRVINMKSARVDDCLIEEMFVPEDILIAGCEWGRVGHWRKVDGWGGSVETGNITPDPKTTSKEEVSVMDDERLKAIGVEVAESVKALSARLNAKG